MMFSASLITGVSGWMLDEHATRVVDVPDLANLLEEKSNVFDHMPIDFKEFLRRGLDAAKQAQENRDEIRDVLIELNNALHSMSGGAAEIAIVPVSSTIPTLSRLVAFLDKSQEEQVLAVRSTSRQDFLARKVARWKQGESGYPCSIIWGDRHASCDDVESLKAELAELVSSPVVGEAIFAVMNLPPAEEQT